MSGTPQLEAPLGGAGHLSGTFFLPSHTGTPEKKSPNTNFDPNIRKYYIVGTAKNLVITTIKFRSSNINFASNKDIAVFVMSLPHVRH